MIITSVFEINGADLEAGFTGALFHTQSYHYRAFDGVAGKVKVRISDPRPTIRKRSHNRRNPTMPQGIDHPPKTILTRSWSQVFAAADLIRPSRRFWHNVFSRARSGHRRQGNGGHDPIGRLDYDPDIQRAWIGEPQEAVPTPVERNRITLPAGFISRPGHRRFLHGLGCARAADPVNPFRITREAQNFFEHTYTRHPRPSSPRSRWGRGYAYPPPSPGQPCPLRPTPPAHPGRLGSRMRFKGGFYPGEQGRGAGAERRAEGRRGRENGNLGKPAWGPIPAC